MNSDRPRSNFRLFDNELWDRYHRKGSVDESLRQTTTAKNNWNNEGKIAGYGHYGFG